MFQFTRPQGARHCISCTHFAGFTWFQFTRPQGARLDVLLLSIQSDGFNSRAHRGRDVTASTCHALGEVSIHAPTGGATIIFIRRSKTTNVSIHAPTGGATFNEKYCFNTINVSIHAPTGGATATGYDVLKKVQVSIHAPTGGATCTAVRVSSER